jgi:hypothetical protein
MSRRKSHNVLTLARKRAKEAERTIAANSKGGRYYQPSLVERLAAAAERKTKSPFET